MARPPPQSFLLRLWRDHATAPMRITVVAVGQPDAHQHFATLAECFAWLYAQSAAPEGASSNLPGNTSIVSQMEDAEK